MEQLVPSPSINVRKIIQVTSAEFTGTFFLAFFVCSSTISSSAAPYAIGIGLVSLIYTFAAISGSQFNPAVTIGLLVTGNLSIYEGMYCILSQCMGSLFAGIMSYALYANSWNDVGYPKVVSADHRPQAFVSEMIVTFGLIWIVLSIAKSDVLANNSFYGLAFGLYITSSVLVVGGISGACFNPAISILTLLHGDYDDMWVFLVGPSLGAVAAGLLYNALPALKQFHYLSTRLLVEFIGSFFITWTVALTPNSQLFGGYLAVGFVTSSMAYHGRHISGGHFNPCISLAVYLRGIYEEPVLLKFREFALYLLAHILGAFSAAGIASYANNGTHHIAGPSVDTEYHTKFAATISAAIFSFGFIITVLHTATNSTIIKHDDYFGIAIGFMTTACALSVGDVGGGILNPVTSVALAVVKNRNVGDLWVYLIGDISGTLAACVMWYVWWPSPEKELPYSSSSSDDVHYSSSSVPYTWWPNAEKLEQN